MRIRVRTTAVMVGLILFIFCSMFYHTLPDGELQPTITTTTSKHEPQQRDRDHELFDAPRWQLFTAASLWDSTQRSPQQSPFGSLHEDLLDAVEAAVLKLNSGGQNRHHQQPYTVADLLDGRYRHQPGLGSEYVLCFTSRRPGMLEKVRLMRPVGPLSVVGSAISSASAIVRLVVPYYHRPDVFGAFMANVAHLVLEARENLQMVVVFYWRGSPPAGLPELQRDRARVAEALRQLNRRAGRPVARLLDQKRAFSRGHALLRGAESPVDVDDDDSDDVLLFFLDIDMYVDVDALRRCRANTAPGSSVYYPIVFSTYNPTLRALAWGHDPIPLWKEHPIDPDVGFWRDFGYGMTCQFRSDFRRVAGAYLISDSLGGEDERLFSHHRKTGIEIVRAPDPGLVHVHHSSRCDRSLKQDKYDRCLRSQMLTEASAGTWVRLFRRLSQRQFEPSGEQATGDSADTEQRSFELICEKCVLDALQLFPE